MLNMKTYAEKLRDPRWQRRRFDILSRDKFTCQSCRRIDRTLHVHHKMYQKGRDPWDYPDSDLVTLCEKCHKNEHSESDIYRIREVATKDVLSCIERGAYVGTYSELLAKNESLSNFIKQMFDDIAKNAKDAREGEESHA